MSRFGRLWLLAALVLAPLIIISAPLQAQEPAARLDLTRHPVGYLALLIFFVAYGFVAIEEAIHLATPGDAVLIAGKGDIRHQELADTIVPFDDRDYARAALETRGTALAKAVRVPAHIREVEHVPIHA